MESITHPGQVVQELNRLTSESSKGVEALYIAEVKVAELDNAYDHAYSLALISNQNGTVEDRKAVARVQTTDLKLQLDLAKAELTRVKAKLKQIESAQVAVSVISRQVEMQWKIS